MAEQVKNTNLLIDLEGLKAFATKIKETYVKQEEGKELIETTEVARLKAIEDRAQVNKIEKVKIDGSEQTVSPDDKSVTLDLSAYEKTDSLTTKLAEYTKTTELVKEPGLLGKFATKDDVDAVKNQVGKLGEVKGSKTKEELADAEGTLDAQPGDIYKVTDDEGKFKMFVGKGEPGADANGYIDLGVSIELSDFATVAQMDAELEKKVDKASGQTLVTDAEKAQITTNQQSITSLQSSLENKVDKEEGKSLVLDSDITQITTNKTAVEALETNKVNKTDVLVATTSEVETAFNQVVSAE